MSIDDCKQVSVKEVKGAIGKMMDEAKARVQGFAGKKMNEAKARLEDKAVEIIESKAHEAIDHVADTIGLDKQMTAQIKVAL